jgi:hypothetical protein
MVDSSAHDTCQAAVSPTGSRVGAGYSAGRAIDPERLNTAAGRQVPRSR